MHKTKGCSTLHITVKNEELSIFPIFLVQSEPLYLQILQFYKFYQFLQVIFNKKIVLKNSKNKRQIKKRLVYKLSYFHLDCTSQAWKFD